MASEHEVVVFPVRTDQVPNSSASRGHVPTPPLPPASHPSRPQGELDKQLESEAHTTEYPFQRLLIQNILQS
jgi:hypothetical protein